MSGGSYVFTEDERSLILHYLGYPKEQAALGIGSNGYRITNTSLQYLESTFYRLSPEGVERVREGLRELRCIDQELSKLRGRASVTKTGDVEMDATKGRRFLLAERRRLIGELSNDLASPINPHTLSGARVSNT